MPTVPIIHFRDASPPFLICVKIVSSFCYIFINKNATLEPQIVSDYHRSMFRLFRIIMESILLRFAKMEVRTSIHASDFVRASMKNSIVNKICLID